MKIRCMESDEDILACYPVMHQLRPALAGAEDLLARVRRMSAGGYQLAAVLNDGVVAASGFRFVESLAWGKAMYIDDLVSDAAQRSRGYGKALLEWLVQLALQHQCEQLHLDSGVQRFGAHRFYLRNGMDITSHHFRLTLVES